MSKRRYPSLIGDCLSYKFRGPRSTWSTLWSNFVASAALGARYDCSHVASAAFSAAKDHFAWQAQHLEHVMIFCVASAAFSAAKDHFAWQAQHLKHVMIKKWHAAVGKPAIVTCFARLKKLK